MMQPQVCREGMHASLYYYLWPLAYVVVRYGVRFKYVLGSLERADLPTCTVPLHMYSRVIASRLETLDVV
jgi:hypothetical protein